MNLKILEGYLGVNLLGLGPRLMKKRIYRAAVSQRLRNTGLGDYQCFGETYCFLLQRERSNALKAVVTQTATK